MKKISSGLLLLMGFYLLTFFVVSPFYEHPIGDDWTYSKVAKDFYETGSFKTLGWYGQSLVFQIWWVFLFLLPFGFSFSALHLSNAVMGGVAIFFFYLLMRQLQFQEKERGWGILLFIISPPFLFGSRTFHTDLPFLALYLAAAWAYARGMALRSSRWLLVGSLFLGASLLIRQVGVFLPSVFAIAFFLDRGRRSFPQKAVLFIPFLVLGIFTVWQHRYFRGIPPANLLLASSALRLDWMLSNLLHIPSMAFLYFGYLLSPLLVPCAFGLFQKRHVYPKVFWLFLLGWIAFGMAVLCFGLRSQVWMPDYFPRGFRLKGSGPALYLWVALSGVTGASLLFGFYLEAILVPLRKVGLLTTLVLFGCAFVLLLPPVRTELLSFARVLLPSVYHFFAEKIHLYQTVQTWQVRLPFLYQQFLLRLLCVSCFGLLLFWFLPLLLNRWKKPPLSIPLEKPEVLLHLASFAYFIFLLFLPVTSDRYLFPVFPSMILLTLRVARFVPIKTSLCWCYLFCVLVLSCLHTDRTIQRVGAFWEGGRQLLSQGVSAEKIDAGFVFNGWHLYDRQREQGAVELTDKGWTEKGWWVVDDEYQVTTDLCAHYAVIGKIPYRDLLVPGPHVVYLTRRRER